MKAILSAALMAVVATPVFAQGMPCGSRDSMVETLTEKYGEAPIGGGMDSRGQVLEVWVNPETGTWTALVTFPDGRSCVPAAGGNWQENLLNPTSGTAL